ncbi:FAD/NAD(P)-binding domain-containing protein [Auricularia subglabra TFB-10046 SS5]|nr:FAD/NAD(P)-binding domain-containing protein [Auricularia subglabra TFB-10046 SS5]
MKYGPSALVALVLDAYYYLLQYFIIAVFRPRPPRTSGKLQHPHGRIAVIGAGLTGVSSAAHCIANGFEVVLFEQKDKIGGIWASVNKTSGLQLSSLLYRFHPAVHWRRAFPQREEILHEVHRVWTLYGLDRENRTRFNTPVTKIIRAPGSEDVNEGGHARWIVNGDEYEVFDAVIVTVGTCGAPKKIHFPGADAFRGQVLHSSELDDAELEGKEVVVVGGGASGVEAVELAIEKRAKGTVLVARDDKWVIPRNIVFDTLISMQPFGREMPLSFIYERLLKTFHYRSAADIAPQDKGIFEGTPIVNDEFLGHVRSGRCRYIRGDGQTLTERGVQIKLKGPSGAPSHPASGPSHRHHAREPSAESEEGKKHRGDTQAQEDGKIEELRADVVVLATGFERPSVDFLPEDLFPEEYSRPNLYLQNFSTEDWSVLMTNSAYVNAIGTVGHFHIGIYTRILLTLLLDPQARPTPRDMKLWVDNLRFVKRGAKGGALGFFTYMELTVWLVLFHVFRPDRLRWMFFIMNGWTFGRALEDEGTA